MIRRRRYVVHLASRLGGMGTQFIIRLHPWASRVCHTSEIGERIFDNECDFIEIVNSVLPSGSDVRNIFSHIESPEGFYYLLELDVYEARRLGWQ